MGFAVLRKTFVVVDTAAGVHHPAQCPLDLPAAGKDDESFVAIGSGDGPQGEPETVFGPGHELAGIGGVGPDLGRWIEAVTAVVVARGDVTEAELIDHAREKLAHFKAPEKVLFVDELPRNATGKILKREPRDRFTSA